MVLPQTEATSSAKEHKCDRPRYVTQIYSSTFFIPLQDFTQIFSCKGGSSMWIFRAWKTTKDGKRIYAKAYGLKAFPIWIDDDSKDNSEEKSDKNEE